MSKYATAKAFISKAKKLKKSKVESEEWRLMERTESKPTNVIYDDRQYIGNFTQGRKKIGIEENAMDKKEVEEAIDEIKTHENRFFSKNFIESDRSGSIKVIDDASQEKAGKKRKRREEFKKRQRKKNNQED